MLRMDKTHKQPPPSQQRRPHDANEHTNLQSHLGWTVPTPSNRLGLGDDLGSTIISDSIETGVKHYTYDPVSNVSFR